MQWAAQAQFNWLWVVAVMTALLIWSHQRRLKRLASLADRNLPDSGRSGRLRSGGVAGAILACGAWVLMVLALARPQWGYEWQDIRRQGIDVMVVLDTSRSMLTRDVRPNRLERARLGVLDFLGKLEGDRIGLVAFAGDAFLVCPLTVDYAGFRLSLDAVNAASVPRGGTNLARAITVGLQALDDQPGAHKVIVLITDGDVLEGDALAAARQARDADVRIFTVGVGTPEGELIQVADRSGRVDFLKDPQGNVVKSRLNEAELRQIAELTRGVYLRAGGTSFGLDALYDTQIAGLEKHEFDARREKRFHERFQIPLALALILLGIQTCRFYKN